MSTERARFDVQGNQISKVMTHALRANGESPDHSALVNQFVTRPERVQKEPNPEDGKVFVAPSEDESPAPEPTPENEQVPVTRGRRYQRK